MKRFAIAGATLALAVPGVALAEDTTTTAKESASAACKAERTQVGETTFKQTWGTNKNRSNAFGKCVSKRAQTEKANKSNAAKACKAERDDANWRSPDGKTFTEFYGTNKKGTNAFGKCVSAKAKAASAEQTEDRVNAAKQCKADRKADAAAFATKWGTKRNAFGKCVSTTAKAQQDDQPQS